MKMSVMFLKLQSWLWAKPPKLRLFYLRSFIYVNFIQYFIFLPVLFSQAVYDLTWEILQEIYAEDPNTNQPQWVKPHRVKSSSFHKVRTPGDIKKIQVKERWQQHWEKLLNSDNNDAVVMLTVDIFDYKIITFLWNCFIVDLCSIILFMSITFSGLWPPN